MLIGGFIALTFCFVLTMENKSWIALDIFSKSAISFVVGALSYLNVILFIFLYMVIRLIITKKAIEDYQFDYKGLIAVIMYAYLMVILIHRKRKRHKIDKYGILTYIKTLGLSSFLFFVLSFTLLLGFIAFQISNNLSLKINLLEVSFIFI